MAVTASADFSASLVAPAQRRRVTLSLYAVTGTSPTFTSTYLGDLPHVGSASMSLDGTSDVVRTMSVDVPLAQLPAATASYLSALGAPFGGNLPDMAMLPGDPIALSGIKSAGGYVNVRWWQFTENGWKFASIAQLRIARISMSRGGTVATLELADWMSAVADSPFVTTYVPVSVVTLQISEAITAIITDAFPPGWVPTIVPVAAVGVGYYPKDGVSFTGARTDAIRELLAGYSTGDYLIVNDELGRFVGQADWIGTYGVPVPPSTKPTTVWTANDVSLGGFLSQYDIDYREDTSYNAVSITWSSADGQTFGQAFVVDNDTSSPTYWNGPYGHHPRPNEQVDTITDSTSAIQYANYRLRTMKNQSLQATLSMPPNPLLQPQDFITVNTRYAMDPARIVTESHLIVSIDLPIDGSDMSLVTQVRSRTVT